MKALIIGQGGREHGLARALRMSSPFSEVHILPGNDGMATEALCHAIDYHHHDQVLHLIKQTGIDLVIIGPEKALASGLPDVLRNHNILVFGPSVEGSQLESSKIYCKKIFIESGIPTAQFQIVQSVEETLKASFQFSAPYILKADGLADGKGVFICSTQKELLQHAELLFNNKILGQAGEKAILEEALFGYEMSYHILTNGKEFQILPQTQDHKRLLEDDKGPNTGGMGVVGPVPINEKLSEQILNQIISPLIKTIEQKKILYRGVLYLGLMITEKGPKVLEINTRFGDPECQVILPLLNGDWGEVFLSIAKGLVPALKWKPIYSTCVVLAAENYPQSPKKNVEIGGHPHFENSSGYFLHAGTKKISQTKWVTAGGRVLNAIGLGNSLNESIKNAYEIASKVTWPGLQMRHDIGKKITC